MTTSLELLAVFLYLLLIFPHIVLCKKPNPYLGLIVPFFFFAFSFFMTARSQIVPDAPNEARLCFYSLMFLANNVSTLLYCLIYGVYRKRKQN